MVSISPVQPDNERRTEPLIWTPQDPQSGKTQAGSP
jgi:hypothetical protein